MQKNNQDIKVKIFLLITSIALLTWVLGFWMAIGILGMIFIHETGHLHAAKRCGLKTKGFYFIPGIGGVALIDPPRNRNEDCYISLAGPIYGLMYCLFMGAIYFFTGLTIFGEISWVCAVINVFNLIPVYPLDGGRIAKAIGFSIHRYLGEFITYSGLIFSLFMLFKAGWILFGAIALMGFFEHHKIGHLELLKPKMTWTSIGAYLAATGAVICMLLLTAVIYYTGNVT